MAHRISTAAAGRAAHRRARRGLSFRGRVAGWVFVQFFGAGAPSGNPRAYRPHHGRRHPGLSHHRHRRSGGVHGIQSHCEARGYSVVREMIGHGVGRKLHEAPEVPNYGRKGNGIMLKSGMTIAIEPMINMGTRNLVFERDGWTTRTIDRKPSAHFEHSIAIRRGKADILSSFEYIEQVLGNRAI